MNEERVKDICYLFLVRKLEGSIEGYPVSEVSAYYGILRMGPVLPDALQMHRPNLHHVPDLL